MTDSIKGALLTMFGGMCWGVSGCVGQYLFTSQGMDSTWLVPIRLFLAGVILCRCGHHFAGSFPRADSAGGLHPAKACAAAV